MHGDDLAVDALPPAGRYVGADLRTGDLEPAELGQADDPTLLRCSLEHSVDASRTDHTRVDAIAGVTHPPTLEDPARRHQPSAHICGVESLATCGDPVARVTGSPHDA